MTALITGGDGRLATTMGWREMINAYMKSGRIISVVCGMTGTGAYVSYADWTRFRRMMSRYAAGNILPPMAEHTYETVYFHRPELEKV